MVLALDASGKTAGICLRQGGRTLYQETLRQGLTHSQTLLPLVQKALAAAGSTLADVDLYAVTAGPGSFTGLRIGLALVKGLAQPKGTPVAPVSTLEAWAAGAEVDGFVLTALDARRSEVYWAAFEKSAGQCRRVLPDAASSAREAADKLVGQTGPIQLVGDAAEVWYNDLKGNLPTNDLLIANADPALGAALLAEAYAQNNQTVPPADARPEYLRLSQAERMRQRALRADTNQ